MGTLNFTDSQGSQWYCRITWAAMRRSTAAGVDLSLVEEHLGDFHRGSPKLIDALWAVLSPQAEEAKITREHFEDRMTGAVLEQAKDALLGGLEDFFPPSRGALIAAAEKEVKQQMEKLLALPNASTE